MEIELEERQERGALTALGQQHYKGCNIRVETQRNMVSQHKRGSPEENLRD